MKEQVPTYKDWKAGTNRHHLGFYRTDQVPKAHGWIRTGGHRTDQVPTANGWRGAGELNDYLTPTEKGLDIQNSLYPPPNVGTNRRPTRQGWTPQDSRESCRIGSISWLKEKKVMYPMTVILNRLFRNSDSPTGEKIRFRPLSGLMRFA